ncbi:zinc ribbon domain-containing protein [Luteolibacter pohnpeiensis]|uniref:Zinc ribbon domain-containing protein n=1 Tax=Luteolibacter pohnpeiensis TaxID=454153 RepID=A0A934S9J9_9BACT|nr:zinc ribbon domain-containing protein [Luteolibacter pohnpeiensis]MBK1883754.1 zinc ribbon domain-containing protein [Luteolibacter pohnpeiensis]
MPTYQYETIPTEDYPEVRAFELKQSMKEAPLSCDPKTGQPVRRVISGGFRPMGLRGRSSPTVAAPSCSHDGGPCCG